MSIFKSSWVVLHIFKLKEKEFLYTIFTSDFWKIKATKKYSKKEKTLDLWYLINFEIETNKNSDINKIKSVKIISEFLNQQKNFIQINNYLTLLSIIAKNTATWVPHIEIIEIIKQINTYNKPDLEIKLVLSQLKIVDILWELNINHQNQTVWKILNFINKNNFSKILKLSWIDKEIKKELQNIL